MARRSRASAAGWRALLAALALLGALLGGAPALAQITDPVGPGQAVSQPAPMCPAIAGNCYLQVVFNNQVVPGTAARCGPFPGCGYSERYFLPDGYRFQMLNVCGANCTTQYWVINRPDNRLLLGIDPVRGGALVFIAPSTTQNDPHPPIRVIVPDYGANDPACCPSGYVDTTYAWDAARNTLVANAPVPILAGDFPGWDMMRQTLAAGQYVEIFPTIAAAGS
jgi:hypothetical protein